MRIVDLFARQEQEGYRGQSGARIGFAAPSPRHAWAEGLGFLALALLGCQSNEPARAPMQPASGSTAPTEQASDKLATARCIAAERCLEFGLETSSDLQDFPHCMTLMRKAARRELDTCPNGVDARRVHGCAEAWAALECSGTGATEIASITGIPECRLGLICRG